MQEAGRKKNHMLSAALAAVLIPAALIVSLPFALAWCVRALVLRLVFWFVARREGKFAILVYSNSPHWKSYFEQSILPQVQDHALVLNWSERSRWHKWSWPVQAFHHWAGQDDFNPVAIIFRSLWSVRVIRFYRAFQKRKGGNDAPLKQVERQFIEDVAAAEKAVRGSGRPAA